MAVHIFVVSEENFEVCKKKGLVAIPEPKEDSRNRDNIFDGLLSRMTMIKEDDYILMYVLKWKELFGVWQAEGLPFYDDTIVWSDRVYPFRCKIKCSKYHFEKPLTLNDLNDLRNSGKIWTWALQRATGTNSMFSIFDYEFKILLREYMKINPFSQNRWIVEEPYPYHSADLLSHIHKKSNSLKYEFSIMAYLNKYFTDNDFSEIFGNYSDFLCYVPTNLGREMDILLMFENQDEPSDIISYDIIEVKRDTFDIEALTQLIDYESWFLQKKVAGDLNMIRTTAIAKSFSDDVIDYVNKRTKIEGKPVKLLKYKYNDDLEFDLERVL